MTKPKSEHIDYAREYAVDVMEKVAFDEDKPNGMTPTDFIVALGVAFGEFFRAVKNWEIEQN